LTGGCSLLRRWERAQQFALAGVERVRQPLARTHHIADKLGLFRSRRLKQHRARIAVENAAHIDQLDGLCVRFALAEIDQFVDEIAQPEALGVDRSGSGRNHGRLPTHTTSGQSPRCAIRCRFSNAHARV